MIRMKQQQLLAAAALALALGTPQAATTAATREEQGLADYGVSVWFDALFDENGKLKELRPQDAAEQPAALWEQLQSRLQAARIQPMQLDGKPVSFRTGMQVTLEVSKHAQGGGVSIKGLHMSPLVLEREFPGYPKDVGRNAGWKGEVTASCTVGTTGHCLAPSVKIDAPAGMPDSVRRWARVTIESWRFKPQELNGQPVEGYVRLPMRLETRNDMPREFREPRKL